MASSGRKPWGKLITLSNTSSRCCARRNVRSVQISPLFWIENKPGANIEVLGLPRQTKTILKSQNVAWERVHLRGTRPPFFLSLRQRPTPRLPTLSSTSSYYLTLTSLISS